MKSQSLNLPNPNNLFSFCYSSERSIMWESLKFFVFLILIKAFLGKFETIEPAFCFYNLFMSPFHILRKTQKLTNVY